MKLLKNTLAIVALFTIGSACAKQTAAKKAPAPARYTGGESSTSTARPAVQQPATQVIPQGPAPALPGQSFMSLMMQVRMMPAEQIISNNGTFTNTFINLVNGANLNTELTRALLEAGRNLHLPLSDDSDEAQAVMISAEENIERFMASSSPILPPISLKPLVNEDPQVEDLVADYYYDQDEATLKQAYLDQRINELLAQRKSTTQIINILQPELNQKMRRAWADNKVGSIATRTNQLNKQIKDTVENTKPLTIGMPTPTTSNEMKKASATPWEGYDASTKQINQSYLEDKVRNSRNMNLLTNELITRMVPEWKKQGFKNIPDRTQQLRSQINNTVKNLSKITTEKEALLITQTFDATLMDKTPDDIDSTLVGLLLKDLMEDFKFTRQEAESKLPGIISSRIELSQKQLQELNRLIKSSK